MMKHGQLEDQIRELWDRDRRPAPRQGLVNQVIKGKRAFVR